MFDHACSIADVPQPTRVSVVALSEAGKARVTWSRPSLGTGQIITSYSVQYRRWGYSSYSTLSVYGSSTTSYTITNLIRGAIYVVKVASIGHLGLSGYCCGSGEQVVIYDCKYNEHNENFLCLAINVF